MKLLFSDSGVQFPREVNVYSVGAFAHIKIKSYSQHRRSSSLPGYGLGMPVTNDELMVEAKSIVGGFGTTMSTCSSFLVEMGSE
jgi:hypothetical protein